MKAVILAGGLGSRLSEETTLKPKPMVEIGGRPILWHIMKIYSAHGINEFIVCLGYKGDIIKDFFANYFLFSSDVTVDLAKNSLEFHRNICEPWRVTLVDTGADTMTGGRLKRVLPYVAGEEAFCFTYGNAAYGKIRRAGNRCQLACAHLHGKAPRRRPVGKRRLLCPVSEGRKIYRGRRHNLGARATRAARA